MLEARSISVSLGRKPILFDVDFDAHPGQVTAIVGPNGSGKTTLLRALTGDIAFRGQVGLNGRDITGMKPWDLAGQRGVLAQHTSVAFPYTVLEIVQMGLSSGLSAGQRDIPLRALAKVGLAGYEARMFQELSGGEQQRVQLARVLSQIWEPVVDGEPRWMLLDEPVAALDIGHQLQVMHIVRAFSQAGGGVVMVMHDLNLTALYADAVTLMRSGAVLAAGAPKQVIASRPLSEAYGCAIDMTAAIPNSIPQFHPAQVNATHAKVGKAPMRSASASGL